MQSILSRLATVAVVLLTTICFLAGCQTSGSVVPSSREASAPYFEENSPGAVKRYDSFYVMPIEAYTIEGDYLRKVDDADIDRLTDEFRAKLIDKLGDRYAVIPQPSLKVAFLKVAITDVSSSYMMFQILPGYVVPNPMRGGATIEAKVIDSVSNRQVAIFRDSRQGARQGYFSGLGKWDGARRAFDEWARLLVTHIRR